MNRLLAFIVGAFWLSSAGIAVGQNQASIRTGHNIRIEVSNVDVFLSHSPVTLGDLATVSSVDHAAANQIRKLQIADLDEGKSVTLARETLLFRVLLAGVLEEHLNLSGPESIVVERTAPAQIWGRFRTKTREALGNYFQTDLDQLAISIDARNQVLQKALTGIPPEFEVSLDPSVKIGLGSSTIKMNLTFPDQTSRQVFVPVNLAWNKEVALLTRPIARGEILRESDIQRSVRPIHTDHIQLVSAEEALGKQASRDLNPMAVIEQHDLMTRSIPGRPDVAANSSVSIVYNSTRLKIRLDGARALSAGKIGDVIDVQHPKSLEKIRCQIIDYGVVQVGGQNPSTTPTTSGTLIR